MIITHDNFKCTLVIILVLIAGSHAHGQTYNLLDGQYHGFELDGWTEGNYWSYSTDFAASGSKSFKFECQSCDGDYKAWGPTEMEGLLNLPIGTYTLKMKVWVSNTTTLPSFNFVIRTPVWNTYNFSLSDISDRDQWVEVSREITISEQVIDDKPMLRVADAGSGIFYIDDIQIIGEGEEPGSNLLLTYSETADPVKMDLPAGIYEAKIQIFKQAENKIKMLETYLTNPWIPIQWNLEDLPENEWVVLSQEISIEKPISQSDIRFQVSNQVIFGGNTGTVYLDDFSLTFIEKKADEVLLESSNLDEGFIVYPNPSTGQLFLQSNEKGRIEIFDLKGQRIWSKSVDSSDYLNLSQLSPGLYMIHFKTSYDTQIKRIVIR